MTHVFHLDTHPRVHLITEAMPGGTWNGFAVPCPTPRELVRFFDELRKEIPDEREWWETLAPLVSYYWDDQPGWNEAIVGVEGFIWQETRMFHPINSHMDRVMADGHVMRKGHPLVAYYTPTDEEQTIFTMVRLCCDPSGEVTHG